MHRARIDRPWVGLGSLISLILLSNACTFTKTAYLAEQWIEQPHGLYLASIRQERPTLQIIITYDGPLSSHAALRLVGEYEQITFWDPAGAYGVKSPDQEPPGSPGPSPVRTRTKDVIVSQTPDIPEYIRFRWEVGDLTVEVYEWDLSSHDARLLEQVLRTGSNGHEQTMFHTETAPAFCTVAISHFLERFARPIMTISDWYLWPHSLAQALLEQRPTRIRVFRPHRRESIYIAPHRSAGQTRTVTEMVNP